MAEKITNIAELKKAIINTKFQDKHSIGDYRWNDGLQMALNLIDEFEASMRERIETFEENRAEVIRKDGNRDRHSIFLILRDELREILGEERAKHE